MLWPRTPHPSQEGLTELTKQGRGLPAFAAAACLGDHTVLALEAVGQRGWTGFYPASPTNSLCDMG